MGRLLDSPRWEVLKGDPAAERRLAEALGVPELVARVLVARGITEVPAARAFLSPSLERDWRDPLAICGMADAARRVEQAVRAGEQIAIFGDFDVDGMSATTLLTLGLRELGAHVEPYIPHRFGEGYGLSREALGRVIEGCHPSLIITVDNGIAAAEEVRWLLGQDIDVVVTDHHEPGDLVPEGVAVCDPKLEPDGASRELAGAGVALKLVQVLGADLGDPDLWLRYTELACLGTISDMMYLDAENRALVADGISHLRHTRRPGIQALAACAGVDLATITSDGLPFSLIPRLNAAGRMGTTDVALQLLLTDDPGEAQVLAASLESTNNERREIESELTDEALAFVEKTYHGQRCIVAGGEGWHEGVKGIVASRVTNRYHVPTILFSIKDGIARGSGRSVGTVDLFHAVEQCSDVLVRFGGHAGAVGVTCEASRLDEFRARLEQVMDALPAGQFVDKGEVAALVSLDEMTISNIEALEVLQPFGQGNKRPLFGTLGVSLRNRARVGAKGNHLRFVATNGVSSVSAIMFRAPEIERMLAWDGAADLVFEPENDTWQGRTRPKLMVKDVLLRDGGDGAGGSDAQTASDEEPLAGQSFPAAGGAAGAAGVAGADGAPSGGESAEDAVALRQRLAGLSCEALTDELRRRMIGEHELLPAQRAALERLGRHENALCVMATGRGKSLIFHLHAAREAILEGKASIFVYPLRALVNDQSCHLEDEFSSLGLKVAVLTGETSQDRREEAFSGFADAMLDVVLTTPEFLLIHADAFARAGRIGFVVIDEAHHAAAAKGGSRAAYLGLPEVFHRLGDPCLLAVSATVSTPCARELCRLFSIDEGNVIIDKSVRSNLHVRDLRELHDREAALVSIVATGEKCVIYVNSRDQAQALCRMLRHAVGELAPRIAFYHAGLPRETRRRVERAFRSGRVCCIVSTSAFGEGVNLPDIRSVVLYHLPFGFTEFNQMSGRAGRDGRVATIYLMFGSRDSYLNERILSSAAPGREDLVGLYRTLRMLQRQALGQGLRALVLSDEEIAQACLSLAPASALDAAATEAGIAVFEELGFLTVEGFGDRRAITMASNPEHMELARSARYLEGQRLAEEFAAFRDWVLTSRPEEMLDRINRPITPDFGQVADE